MRSEFRTLVLHIQDLEIHVIECLIYIIKSALQEMLSMSSRAREH